MAATGGAVTRPGWYPDPDDADDARCWDGARWTEPRAPRDSVSGSARLSWFWRLGALSILPWLAFELVLLLVPVWAPDESYSFGGSIATAAPLLIFVGAPGVVLAIVTTRRSVRAVEGVVLVATAISAAIAMVGSDDGQAGLAVFWMWFVAVPLLAAAVVTELWMRHRLTMRRAIR